MKSAQNDQAFSLVSSSKELGFQLTYNKMHSHATQHQKHNNAFKQLKQRQLWLPLSVKALLIFHTAISSALHGATLYVVGANWLKQLMLGRDL